MSRIFKYSLYAVIITLLLIASSSAKTKICNTCGKDINQAYITAEGKYFHPEHFVCYRCKKQIDDNGYFYENGKFYDRACYEKMHRVPCDYCGGDIEGRYIEYEGKNYHRECYDKNIALKCNLCGSILEGEYIYDVLGNKYCKSHIGKDPQCDYCQSFFGAPTNEGGYRYDDGRSICSRCKENAVDDSDDLYDITSNVNSRLSTYGLDIPLDSIELNLVDHDELVELQKSGNERLMGITLYRETSSFFGLIKERKLNVHILEGLPRMWAIQTVAHELNHVWQILKSNVEKDTDFCEGSCNYASYLVLSHYDGAIAEMLIEILYEDDDPAYGEGFRRVGRLVDLHGLEYWKSRLADDISFPDEF